MSLYFLYFVLNWWSIEDMKWFDGEKIFVFVGGVRFDKKFSEKNIM